MKFNQLLLISVLGLLFVDTQKLTVQAARQRRRREESRDISAQEVEEITNDNTIEDNPDESAEKQMMEEWDTHMSDFVPDDMLTVQLSPRQEIVSNLL